MYKALKREHDFLKHVVLRMKENVYDAGARAQFRRNCISRYLCMGFLFLPKGIPPTLLLILPRRPFHIVRHSHAGAFVNSKLRNSLTQGALVQFA